MGDRLHLTSKKGRASNRCVKAAGQGEGLLRILANNPYQTLPTYEKLLGTSSVTYSRRINLQHRLVYEVMERDRTIRGHSHVDPLRIIGKL